MIATLPLLTLLLVTSAAEPPAPERAWPQFRGPDARGVLDGVGLPVEWSGTENIVWKTEIPGTGWSSPIVWGDRVFVTSAISDGAFKEPTAGIFGNGTIAQMLKEGKPVEEAIEHIRERDTETAEEAGLVRRVVYCLDVATGATIWAREAHVGRPEQGRHRKNTWASETPITDGENLYVYFGNLGLFAYTLDGEPLWSTSIEPRKVYLDFGTGSSLAMDGERLYVLFDNDELSWLAAFDKATGEEAWRQIRGRGPNHSGWSTPLVWENSVRTEIVTTGVGAAISYSPEGEELWRFEGFPRVTAPVPVAAGDRILLSAGSTSEPVRSLLLVRAGATGDITLADDESESEHVAWYQPKGGTYIPTPVIYDGRVWALYDKGFLAAFDLETGERLFMSRVGRGRSSFSSSPWAYDDRIFLLSEEGETFVVESADEYRLLGTNPLDELTLATPALSEDGLFVRTERHLYRISRTAGAASREQGAPRPRDG